VSERTARPRSRSKDLKIAGLLFGLVGGMVGLSFAAVPLYQWFCQVTGYAGTPRTDQVTEAPGAVAGQDRVQVTFDSNINGIAWRFKPLQADMTVVPGEQTLAFYRATNLSDKTVVGTSTFNVSPAKVGPYFAKIDCFCFTEQTLGPGESVDMPVTFFVDPEMLTDPQTAEVRTLTLSYTFFEVDTPQAEAVSAKPAGEEQG
jgi:cytochrome c oxidase assembly protein subunit 11